MDQNAVNIDDLSKAEIIQKCQELIGRGWKHKLAERAQMSPGSITHWVNGRTRQSFKAETMARLMIKEELKIRALFPNRV